PETRSSVVSSTPPPAPLCPLFPYTPLFRSPRPTPRTARSRAERLQQPLLAAGLRRRGRRAVEAHTGRDRRCKTHFQGGPDRCARSEEHTSELQSRENLVCRLLPENNANHFA